MSSYFILLHVAQMAIRSNKYTECTGSILPEKFIHHIHENDLVDRITCCQLLNFLLPHATWEISKNCKVIMLDMGKRDTGYVPQLNKFVENLLRRCSQQNSVWYMLIHFKFSTAVAKTLLTLKILVLKILVLSSEFWCTSVQKTSQTLTDKHKIHHSMLGISTKITDCWNTQSSKMDLFESI